MFSTGQSRLLFLIDWFQCHVSEVTVIPLTQFCHNSSTRHSNMSNTRFSFDFILTEEQNERSNCTEISVWSNLVGVFCDAHIRSVVVHCVIIGFADAELWPAVVTPCDRVWTSQLDWLMQGASRSHGSSSASQLFQGCCLCRVSFFFPKMGKMGCVASPHVTSTWRSRLMICQRQVEPEPSCIWLTGGVTVVNKVLCISSSFS